MSQKADDSAYKRKHELGQDSYDDKNKKRNRSRVFVLYSDTEDEMPQDEVPGKVGFPKPTGLPGPVAAGMSLKEVKLESVDKGPRFERAKLVAELHVGLAKTTARSDIHTTTAHKRLTPVKLATCNRDVDELEQELQLAREKTQHAADQTAALINQEKDVKKTVHKVHTVLIDGVDALISIVRPHCIGEAECFMEALDEIKQVAEQQGAMLEERVLNSDKRRDAQERFQQLASAFGDAKEQFRAIEDALELARNAAAQRVAGSIKVAPSVDDSMQETAEKGVAVPEVTNESKAERSGSRFRRIAAAFLPRTASSADR